MPLGEGGGKGEGATERAVVTTLIVRTFACWPCRSGRPTFDCAEDRYSLRQRISSCGCVREGG
eukprot:3882592-Prymnesium_polylepis.1